MNDETTAALRERVAALEVRLDGFVQSTGHRLESVETSLAAMRVEIHGLTVRLSVLVALASAAGSLAPHLANLIP